MARAILFLFAVALAGNAEARTSHAHKVQPIDWELSPAPPAVAARPSAQRLPLLANDGVEASTESDGMRVRVRGTRVKMRVPLTLR